MEQSGPFSEEQIADSEEVTELLPIESALDAFLSSAEQGLFLVSSQQDIQVNPLIFDTQDGTFVVFDYDDEDEKDLGR